MQFQQYLEDLDQAIRGGGNFRSAIFDEVPNLVGTPTREQLLSFLTKLAAAIQTETGSMGFAKNALQASARGRAIAEISNFVDDRGTAAAFSNIDKYKFAFQLALRVRSPRIINQDQTTLCGPVAMVYDIAKRDPERYVRFAISLFTTGAGLLGTSQVFASFIIRSGYSEFLPEADYVVLASIRDSDAIVFSLEPLRNVMTLTKPGALCEFLRQAGFSNIQDHSFLTLTTPLKILNALTSHSLNAANHNAFDQGSGNLQALQTQLNQGRFVVMNADAEVARSFYNGYSRRLTVRPDPLPAAETHWTAIRKLRIVGNTVRMKMVTWGGSFESVIPKDALLSRYAGFISADP